MFVQCVYLTNKSHRGLQVAVAERLRLFYIFHNIDTEFAQTAPQMLLIAKHSYRKWW